MENKPQNTNLGFTLFIFILAVVLVFFSVYEQINITC